MNETGKVKILIIAIIVVAMLALAFGAVFFLVIKPKMHGPKKHKEVEWEKEFTIIKVEDFTDLTVTTADEPPRVFQVTLAFEVRLKDKALPEELEMKKAMISQTIFQLLSSFPLEELNNPDSQKAVKERLKNAINNQLSKGKINSVIFERYASQ
jgi:flagellar basal body-associated protein FliL